MFVSPLLDVVWNLKTVILSFCAFSPPHTSIAIVIKLIELLKDWGYIKKCFLIKWTMLIFSNDTMQDILKRQLQKDLVYNGELFHVRCSTHILSLIVQDGLAMISKALQKIKDI